MLRKQQATMAEGEQALQRMRTVELPSLRDELRREASRAASSDAKLAAVEQQLGATSQALREAREAGIAKEQAVAVAKSGQLAKELELAEKEQLLAAEGRRAGVAEAEARAALERQAGLMDALAEAQAELRRKEALLHAAAERERTEVEVTQQAQLRKLAEAEEAARVSAAEAAGGEARHKLAVESVKALQPGQ